MSALSNRRCVRCHATRTEVVGAFLFRTARSGVRYAGQLTAVFCKTAD